MQNRPIVKRTALPTMPRQWRSVHIRPSIYLAVVLVVFLGVIGAAQAAGWWSTTGRTTTDGVKIQITGTDPTEIKGWMTIGDVLTAYKVPKADLYTRFGIPSDVPESAQLKSLEGLAPDFSVTDLQAWVAERSAGP
jgi:preprotein translocase subunit Sec63